MKNRFFVFLLSFIPRLICLLFYFRSLTTEQSQYWRLSSGLVHYGTLGDGRYPETFMEPLYPLFLAAARVLTSDSLFLTMLCQILLASLGAVYLYKLSLELSGKKTVAYLAVLFYSFYPYLIYQSVMLVETSIFMTLLIVSCYFYLKSEYPGIGYSCKTGIAFGLTLLTRMAAMPIVALSVMFLLFKKKYIKAFTISFVTVSILLPFGVRNYRLQHAFLPTRGGRNLFNGNCIYASQIIPRYSVDFVDSYASQLLTKEEPHLKRSDEKAVDQFFLKKAVQFIKENPWLSLRQKFLNVIYIFFPRIVPFHPVDYAMRVTLGPGGIVTVEKAPTRKILAELSYSIPYSFLLITAIVGVYFRRRNLSRDFILGAVVLSFAAVYSIFWPATRYRLPMDFVLMFYSAVAVDRCWTARSAHTIAYHRVSS